MWLFDSKTKLAACVPRQRKKPHLRLKWQADGIKIVPFLPSVSIDHPIGAMDDMAGDK